MSTLSLQISIPNFLSEDIDCDKYYGEKVYPLKSDSSGWFSVIYERWCPEKIASDLVHRIKMVEIDYEHALYDRIFDVHFLRETEAIEDVILVEFYRIELNITRATRVRLHQLLESLENIKVKYLKEKSR